MHHPHAPHDTRVSSQDTGGFFIALLRKLAPLPPTALNVRIRPRPPHGLAVQAGTIAQEPTDVPAADDEDETRGTAASDDGDVAADSASGQQQEVTPAPAALEPAAPVVVEAIAAPSVVGAIVPAPTAVVDAVDAVVSVAAEPRNVVVALKAAQGTVDDLYRRVSPTIATLLTVRTTLVAHAGGRMSVKQKTMSYIVPYSTHFPVFDYRPSSASPPPSPYTCCTRDRRRRGQSPWPRRRSRSLRSPSGAPQGCQLLPSLPRMQQPAAASGVVRR